MATTSDGDENLTFLTPRRTANTPIASPSSEMTTAATPVMPEWPEGDPHGVSGLQPQSIGALLPGWLEKFTAMSAVHAQREQAARDAFLAAGGACWTCRDTGYVGGITPEDETDVRVMACEQCPAGETVIARWRAELVAEALSASNLPRRLERLSFDTLPAAAKARAARVRRFAQTWDYRSGTGLFLQGDPSVGKSGLLVSALRVVETRWADETPVADLRSPRAAPHRHRVWFTTDVALLDTLRKGYEDNTASLLIDRAKTVALLIVDDLGKADYKGGAGWGVERLYDIIDARYSALLPTWFTSNFGADQLETRLGEPGEAIMERITDSCEAITIKGTKLRMGVSA